MNTESEMLDVAFTLLSNSRRRYLLYRLEDESPVTTEELSLVIAAWERDVPVEAVREDDRKQVEIELVHSHLPRLAELDILETDRETGEVVTAERFAEIRPLVERARSTERSERTTDDGTVLSQFSAGGHSISD